ncbi:MAG: hypothetical protein JSW10_12960 [Pseudomonadota bacterium]|nr:MAG: hypothetical protein JSW10_12960 [Pseudomonadota bacterium]
MSEPSPPQKLLLDELNGKKIAVQTYDDRIWTIRTGALTLTFAAWGAAIAVGENLDTLKSIAWVLAVGSFVLLVTGFAVEYFYVLRKYRCIRVLDKNADNIYRWMHEDPPPTSDEIEKFLSFSGDAHIADLLCDEKKDPPDCRLRTRVKKFRDMFLEGILIYFVTAVVFLIVAWVLSPPPAGTWF